MEMVKLNAVGLLVVADLLDVSKHEQDFGSLEAEDAHGVTKTGVEKARATMYV